MDLNEMQFELLPYEEAADGIGFGIGLDVSIDNGGFQPGQPEWVTQDSENPSNGATAFGQDHLTGPEWSWELHLNRDKTTTALETLGLLESAWRAPEIMQIPGAVTAVRYRVGDRVRRVFGRPRAFKKSLDNLLLGGYAPVTSSFKCVDAYTYDDLESFVTIGMMAASQGGFVFPVTFPVQTLPVGEQSDQAVVDGDAATYPIIRFDGPVTNPSLETSAWSVSLATTIADGEFVEIDTRPWVQSVLYMGTTSLAGALGKRQYIEDMKLQPGRHDLLFRGSGGSEGTTCEVRWRSAWNSI